MTGIMSMMGVVGGFQQGSDASVFKRCLWKVEERLKAVVMVGSLQRWPPVIPPFAWSLGWPRGCFDL